MEHTKYLEAIPKSQKEIHNIIDHGRKEKNKRNQKKALLHKTKFSPREHTEIFVTPPSVSNKRKLFNAESAEKGNCAKIISCVDEIEEKVSKRQIKKNRVNLAKHNFCPLPPLPDLDINTPPSRLEVMCNQLFTLVMRNADCYFCQSKNISYAYGNDYWASINCRSCQSDFSFHPLHGIVSNLTRIAITNPINNVGGIEQQNQVVQQSPQAEKPIKRPSLKRPLHFDNSHIKMAKHSKLDAIVKLPFAKQKKIINSGLRPVNTIPVQESLSYKNALVNKKYEIDQLKNIVIDYDDNEHIQMFRNYKRKFFYMNKFLFDRWQKSKIDKFYKNPYLSNAKEFLNRLNNEPVTRMPAAYSEWVACARTFGIASGKVLSNWSQ